MPLAPLLLWTALLSSGTLLVRALRVGFKRGGPFGFIALIPFAVAALTTLFAPELRTLLVVGSWLLWIVVPAVLLRRVNQLQLQQRYGTARRVLLPALVLHPFPPWRRLPPLLAALDRAQRGQVDQARAELERQLADPSVDAGTRLVIRTFLARLDGTWEALLPWLDDPALSELQRIGPRLRALGEAGRLVEMVAAVREHRARKLPFQVADLLSVLAFGGFLIPVQWLVAKGGPLSGLSPEAKSLWIATAEQAAGATEAAREKLTALAASAPDDLRRAAARRLEHPARIAREALPPADAELLAALASELPRASAVPNPFGRPVALRASPATLALIAINVAVFALELVRGGGSGEDPQTLFRMGALLPEAVFEGREFWRLLASTFLHFGPAHLAMNMFGLAILGPRVEAWLGRVRMVVVYIVAGVGSMASALVFMRLGWMRDEFLVGASGSIMALVGALAVLQLRAFLTHRSPVARQALANIGLILGLQAVFDLSMPQVSFAAHASGVVLGALLTAALEP